MSINTPDSGGLRLQTLSGGSAPCASLGAQPPEPFRRLSTIFWIGHRVSVRINR